MAGLLLRRWMAVSEKTGCRCVSSTSVLQARAFVKTRRDTVEVARERETRKRTKVLTRIREVEQLPRVPKPITEHLPDHDLLNNLQARQREPVQISEDELDRRARVLRRWSNHQNELADREWQVLTAMYTEQAFALEQLRRINPDWHAQAVKVDVSLLGTTNQGPRFTPPIKHYEPVDGDFTETTKVYD